MFELLVRQVRDRLLGWHNRLLSPGGKLTLILYVLSSKSLLRPLHLRFGREFLLAGSFMWSVLIWRLMLDKLPMDDQIQKINFHLASGCYYCPFLMEESSTHIFAGGDITVGTWDFFHRLCQASEGSGAFCEAWWTPGSRKVNHIIVRVVCWVL